MLSLDKCFEFKKNDKIVVGCSAGPDSMALVDMLLKIKNKYNLFIIIAHVNHNVRRESYEEADFLNEYCIENNLLFESMIIEEYGDDNFHNEARNIRYNFFDSIVHKYDANYLMTAHHGDDLMETILMRIVRGSNLRGYSGFKKIVDMNDYKIVRPLVSFTKSDLEEYDKLNNVRYYIDSSNSKDKYTRNRYRKYVLPFLKSEDKMVHNKFLKFSNLLCDADKFIESITQISISNCISKEKLNIDKFLLEDSYIQKEILYYMLGEFYQDDLILINDSHIDLINKLIRSKKANCFVNLPNNVIGRKNYNFFVFVRDTEVISSYEIEFDRYAMLPNKHSIELIDYTTNNSNNICRLKSSDIHFPITIRPRRLGDKMKVKGMNGTKKVKDIFIDSKIALNERDSWPIVVDALNNIIWIPGIKKSKFDKKISEDYDIILKYN